MSEWNCAAAPSPAPRGRRRGGARWQARASAAARRQAPRRRACLRAAAELERAASGLWRSISSSQCRTRERWLGGSAGGGQAGLGWELLRRPRWLVGTSELARRSGGTFLGTRNGRGLRRRVGSGGGDHRPGARPRSAPGSAAQSRAAGERCLRATGGAARRGSTRSTPGEHGAGELH